MADGANTPLAHGGELSREQGFALFNPPAEKPEDENNQAATAGNEAGDGAPEPQSEPDEGDDADAADGQLPSETEETETADVKSPPLAPPTSWTKAEKEAFAALPREHQETWLERERASRADRDRRFNEINAKTKAIEAKEQAAEQARYQYEQGVQQLANATQNYLNGNFADIRGWEDVQRLAAEDPIRYNEWTVARQRAEAAQVEQQRVAQGRQQQAWQNFNAYKAAEQAKFLEAAPELADPKQAPQISAGVRSMLIDELGVTPQELKALWDDGAPLSIHDHRMQQIIYDAYKYRTAKTAVAKKPAPAKPVTPVQKPGPAPEKGEERSSRLKQISQQLDRTGGRLAGLELIKARMGAGR